MKILEIQVLLEENNYTNIAPNIVMLKAIFMEIYAVIKAVHYFTIF